MLPGFGRREIFTAQARTGYARMQAYSRSLAALSGHRANAIFEARRITEETAERVDDPGLRSLPEWKQCRFDAYLAQALMLALLGDRPTARRLLDEARGLDPEQAEKEPRYFYARGKAEAALPDRIDRLRRSVDLADRFDVALFDLAWASDIEWRRSEDLKPLRTSFVLDRYDKLRTSFVLDRYDEVTKVNPSNVQAWANAGYLQWMIGDPAAARDAYARGLEYKEITRQTVVSELRFGLARVGRRPESSKRLIDTAYRQYLRSSPKASMC